MSRKSKAKRDSRKKKQREKHSYQKKVILDRDEKLGLWYAIHFSNQLENLSCMLCADYKANHCPGHNLDDEGVDICAEAQLSSYSNSYEIRLENNRGGLLYMHFGRNGDWHIHVVASDEEIAEKLSKISNEMGFTEKRYEGGFRINTSTIGYC